MPRSSNGRQPAAGTMGAIGELAQMVEAAQDSNSPIELRERMAEVELALEDMGWYRLGYETAGELSRGGLRRLTSICRALYLKHPLINHAVDIATHYVWGQGISVVAKSAEINSVVQSWWNLKENRVEITGHRARMLKERELRLAGNVFLALFTKPDRGTVRTRAINADEIDRILTNPQDRREPWYYVRTYVTADTFNTDTGRLEGSNNVTEYYPDWQYQPPGQRPKEIEGHPVRWDAPVYHMKVGGLDNMQFGVPEIFSAIDWARAVQKDLEQYATMRAAYARFAWTLTLKPRQGGGLAKAREQLQSSIDAISGGGETNPPPVVGSTFIQRQGAGELQPVRTGGAQPSPDDGRRLGLMAGSGLGIPEPMLWGDATVGNYATAKSLDRPTELSFLTRQKDWIDTFVDLTNYVVDQSALARQGQLKNKKIIDPYSGDAVLQVVARSGDTAGQVLDRRVDIAFPSILEHDPKDELQAIVSAATLNGQAYAGFIDKRTLARLMLIALRINNVDEVLAQIHPDEPNPPAVQPDVPSTTTPPAAPPAPGTTPPPAPPADQPGTPPTESDSSSGPIRLEEPLQECQLDGQPGYRWGDSGKCYTYTAGNDDSRGKAKQKAYQQGYAMGESALAATAELRERFEQFETRLLNDLVEARDRSHLEQLQILVDGMAASRTELQPLADAVMQLSQRPIVVEQHAAPRRRVKRDTKFVENERGHVVGKTEVEEDLPDAD